MAQEIKISEFMNDTDGSSKFGNDQKDSIILICTKPEASEVWIHKVKMGLHLISPPNVSWMPSFGINKDDPNRIPVSCNPIESKN